MPRIDTRKLVEFLSQETIVTRPELRIEFATDVDITISRALKKISYRTSYSHGGRYYALDRLIRFDENGLWSYRSVWFSTYGTLMTTLARFIAQTDNGYFAKELEEQVHVGVNESLLRLVTQKRVCRERVSGLYLYCSPKKSIRLRQLALRKRQLEKGKPLRGDLDGISDEVKAAIVLFVGLLDEQGRRLFAGVEALQFGHDAEGWIAELVGIHPQTVAKGRRELLEKNVDVARIRKAGAGRPRVEKKRQRSSRRSAT